jgi:hypothetical protein
VYAQSHESGGRGTCKMAYEPELNGHAYGIFGMESRGSGNYDSVLHVKRNTFVMLGKECWSTAPIQAEVCDKRPH